jgi:hypothetical protein
LAAVPVDTTIHSDAYRDINDSWEADERGFIAEDEEAACGLQGDRTFWASKNVSFGVEGGNGALVALGPVPGFAGIADYYWHGHAGLGMWNRIVTGSDQGLDSDLSAAPNPSDVARLQKTIYTKAMVLSMQMTDELVDETQVRFRKGGNATHWPYGGGWIQYRQGGGAVFVPAVLTPPAGTPKAAPTRLAENKVRV